MRLERSGKTISMPLRLPSLKRIMMVVSWGEHESLILPRCASLLPGEFDPMNQDHWMLRFGKGFFKICIKSGVF
jgi:hypothetical protein